jgi:hypothetical protein
MGMGMPLKRFIKVPNACCSGALDIRALFNALSS